MNEMNVLHARGRKNEIKEEEERKREREEGNLSPIDSRVKFATTEGLDASLVCVEPCHEPHTCCIGHHEQYNIYYSSIIIIIIIHILIVLLFVGYTL